MTTTTDAPSNTAIADVLDKAADILDRNGLHKGYLYDEEQADTGLLVQCCRVDTVGAVNVAVFGTPRWPAEQHPGSLLAQAAVLALQEAIGQPVPGWNDKDERTSDDIITALWDAAEKLRKEQS